MGVRYVLEGSVRKAGNRVRITTQLIEAETGVHVWAERYDRSLDDIFALQDEITLSTIGAIEPTLRAAEIERVKRKRPDDLDAYDLVLRALPHVNASMPDEARIAVPLLERALALEPDYGLAHGYLAWCFEILFLRGGLDPEIAEAAVRHAHAAITHGRDDAIALGLAGLFEPRIGARGSDASGLGEQVIPGIAAGIDDLGGIGEDAVGEAVVPEVEPEALDRVQLGRIGRQEHQAEIGRHHQVAADVPAGLVHQDDGMRTGTTAWVDGGRT